MQELFRKHETFVTTIYKYVFYIMLALSAIERIIFMASDANNEEYGSFFMQIFLFMPLVMLKTLISTAIVGTVILVISFIPYLVIRGLKN